MRRLSLALGLAVLLGIYLVAARARHDGGGSPYVTMPVERGPITAHVTATGSVNPVKTVQVCTYVSGPIQVISVDFNSPVQRGQLLAKIDPRPFQVKVDGAAADLANARARLDKDRADLALKEVTLKRTRALRTEGIVSESDLDLATSQGPWGRGGAGSMKLVRMTLLTAWRALRRNLTRSLLTMLGVVIGVAAVIAMVSVGQGADASVEAQIASLGTNTVMVIPGATTVGGARTGWGGVSTLTAGDARAIEKECPSVSAVTWIKREVAQVTYGNRNWSTAIQGSPPSYTRVRDWSVVRGRFYTQSEEDGAAKVAVLGLTIADQLFAPGEDLLGAAIRVKNVPFRVIGVLGPKGQTSWGQDQDDVVIVPFSTAERRVLGTAFLGTVNMILVSSPTSADAVQAEGDIARLLRVRHRTPAGGEDDFTVRSMRELFAASLMASQVMTRLLAAIASLSLLVGGIGIMNILLVSVTERTREIGVRLAVGAKARHILLQFLVEAIVLSTAGGILGTLLGIGAAVLIGRLAAWPILVSPPAVAIALVFSGVVGLAFGVYPARRAARLDPIVALRHE